MQPAITKLSDLNAALVESATVIATYQDALSFAIRVVLDMRPTSVYISLSFQKRGFVIAHNGYVDISAVDLRNEMAQIRPLEVLSTVSVVCRIGASKKTMIKCVSFGEVTRSCCLLQEMQSSITVHNLFRNIPVRFRILEKCLRNKSKAFFDLKLIVQKYALIHSLIRWRLIEQSESASLTSFTAGNGNLMNRFLNIFRPSCETPVFVSLNQSNIILEGLCWSWTERCQFRIQQFYFNDLLIDIPPFADLIQRCVLLVRADFKVQILTQPSFIITIRTSHTAVQPVKLDAKCIEHWKISSELNRFFRKFLFAAFRSLYPNCDIPLKIGKLIEVIPEAPQATQTFEPVANYHQLQKVYSSYPLLNENKDNKCQNPGANSIQTPFDQRFCNKNEIFELSTRSASANFEVKFHRDMISRAEVLNQIENKFIIAKIPYLQRNLLVAVDQHAADERIKLEILEDQLHLSFVENRIGCVVLPQAMVLDWSAKDASDLEFHRELIKKWGFRFTKLPSDKICLQRCPKILGEILTAGDLLDFVRLIRQEGAHKGTQPPKLKPLLACKACKSAITFGVQMTKTDCKHLLQKLALCRFPFQCAHGRPSMVPLGIFGHSHQ